MCALLLPMLLPACCRADDGHEGSHSVLQGHQCLHTHDDNTVSVWQELDSADIQQHAMNAQHCSAWNALLTSLTRGYITDSSRLHRASTASAS
jgi:hypothetical protein